jgi:hypothetical protein
MLLYSPSRELSTFGFDYDWNNDGSLDLPTGVQVVDSLGVRTLGLNDQVYGPTSNILSFTATEVDSVSRKRNDSDRNDGTAWFGGNLTSAGDDYLLYEASSTALPVTGASMSPGDLNAGTAVQSPLVALTGVTVNANGTVTVSFNGPVSQALSGDGGTSPATGSGISITDASGAAIPVIDALPTVTSIGSNALTLSLTGSGVTAGLLPPGTYQLNFVGNGLVANSRAVDVANNGTQSGGFFEFEFKVSTVASSADFNDDNIVDGADFLAWQRGFGKTGNAVLADGDADGDAAVDGDDLTVWKNQFGGAVATAAAPATTVAAAAITAPITSDTVESPLTPARLVLPTGAWLSLPTGEQNKRFHLIHNEVFGAAVNNFASTSKISFAALVKQDDSDTSEGLLSGDKADDEFAYDAAFSEFEELFAAVL